MTRCIRSEGGMPGIIRSTSAWRRARPGQPLDRSHAEQSRLTGLATSISAGQPIPDTATKNDVRSLQGIQSANREGHVAELEVEVRASIERRRVEAALLRSGGDERSRVLLVLSHMS